MNSRVFVVEPYKLDVSQAVSYGHIEYIFDHNDRRSSMWSLEFLTDIDQALNRKKFDPNKDFFVATGKIVLVTIVMLRMFQIYGRIRCLFFDAVDRRYVEREFNSNETRRDSSVHNCTKGICSSVPTGGESNLTR